MNYTKVFAILSYLQYPFILIGVYFTFMNDFDKVLIFMGLGVGFATLQDTTKTQNKLDRLIYENPKAGKITLGILTLMTFLIIGFGVFGYLNVENEKTKELSIGFIVIGLGFIGALKTGAEMFDNHRKDKKQE